jgi:hypothetical protein
MQYQRCNTTTVREERLTVRSRATEHPAGNSANINNNLVNSGSASGSLFASSNDPALYCNQLLQNHISQISTWLQQCTSAALTSGVGGGFADAMRYCIYLYQLKQNNNFLTQNQNKNAITTPSPQSNVPATEFLL